MAVVIDSKPTTFKVPLKTSFLRYNASAYTASFCDYLIFLLLRSEYVGIYYPIAKFIGSCVGATIAFILGRNWTFKNKDVIITKQSIRFGAVVAGSILLNTVGTYLVTEGFHIDEKYSAIIVAIFVGVSYNFPMQRYFVFR